MSGALLVLGGIVYIGLSLYFKFTPRLRVVVGLLVGALLAGVVTRTVRDLLSKGIDQVSGPVGRFIGQEPHQVEVAIPSVVAFALAVVVVVFLSRRGKAGAGPTGKGSAGKGGGKGGGGLAVAALCCALLLPIVATSISDAIRSVST